jgi:GNAT superfamily N-acetyltransferase
VKAEQSQLTQLVRAGPEHAFALAALELQLNRERGRPGEEGFLSRYADAWLADASHRPSWVALSLDGRPLGAITLYVVPGLPTPGRTARPRVIVTHLFVTSSARRNGLGERLVRAAMAWASDNNASSLDVDATDPALGLFRKAGFRRTGESALRLSLTR